MSLFNEDVVEKNALEWFKELGYDTGYGPDLAPQGLKPERSSLKEVVLVKRLQTALHKLNQAMPKEALDQALRKILQAETSSLVENNRRFHAMLRDGVEVEYRRPDGSIAGDRVRLIDFEHADANDWFVVNQFTVIEGDYNCRPDLVIFVNGLPVGVIELKNPAREETTLSTAFVQIQKYKQQISSLFHYNEVLVISDGMSAKMGSLTAKQEWFKVWQTINGDQVAPPGKSELYVLIHGVFEKTRFLMFLQHFIVFEDDGTQAQKIIAGYHQFHAVNQAVKETLRASSQVENLMGLAQEEHGIYFTRSLYDGKPGDRRAGVVWHTQGCGKSLSMLFYAGRIVRHPAMKNPTVVVLTDRNDLDDQLFGQFQRCHELLRQKPVQAESAKHLHNLLQVASGGVIFTTIQKFIPPEAGQPMMILSNRHNIVVIADEAHRSQYSLIDGFARNMRSALPRASFLGFTGTPIEKADANTRAVFGGYVSIYDMKRAVADGATVPIHYESRISKVSFQPNEFLKIDGAFEELTEGENEELKQTLKSKWANDLEVILGNPKRLEQLAQDIVQHYESRVEALEGKAMVVCMSRQICIDLYHAMIKLRPDWASSENEEEQTRKPQARSNQLPNAKLAEENQACVVKVIITGDSQDRADWQMHIRTKEKRRALAHQFKDPNHPFRIAIVCDMWLTGFDVPCLHTMYIDKPLQGHNLMQAIARVNRVFRDKGAGLIVDYLGLTEPLQQAFATYTDSGGQGSLMIDSAQAVATMQQKYNIVCALLQGFDFHAWKNISLLERSNFVAAGLEHIFAQHEGQVRFCEAVKELSYAFALCAATDEAAAVHQDIAFFQVLKTQLTKTTGNEHPTQELDQAVKQLVSQLIVTSDGIIDIFSTEGMEAKDISVFSEPFLTKLSSIPYKHVATERLAKLLADEILCMRNASKRRTFSEMLQKTLNDYHNRALSVYETFEQLKLFPEKIKEDGRRTKQLDMSDEEIVFYDSLDPDSHLVQEMGIEKLKTMAKELVAEIKNNLTIDWTRRSGPLAKIRVLLKNILKKHGYPEILIAQTQKMLLEQAELLYEHASQES